MVAGSFVEVIHFVERGINNQLHEAESFLRSRQSLRDSNTILNIIVKQSKYNQNYQVKEDELGRPCSTNGREEECI
jgi:hypothetical protein